MIVQSVSVKKSFLTCKWATSQGASFVQKCAAHQWCSSCCENRLGCGGHPHPRAHGGCLHLENPNRQQTLQAAIENPSTSSLLCGSKLAWHGWPGSFEVDPLSWQRDRSLSWQGERAVLSTCMGSICLSRCFQVNELLLRDAVLCNPTWTWTWHIAVFYRSYMPSEWRMRGCQRSRRLITTVCTCISSLYLTHDGNVVRGIMHGIRVWDVWSLESRKQNPASGAFILGLL